MSVEYFPKDGKNNNVASFLEVIEGLDVANFAAGIQFIKSTQKYSGKMFIQELVNIVLDYT